MLRYSAFVVLSLAFMSASYAEDAKTEPPKKEEKKPETKEGYSEAVLGCGKCAFGITETCAPAIKIGTVVYLIKMDDKIDEKTKKLLDGTSGKKEVVKVKVKGTRSEEHTSELQSQFHLVCRLLLE